MFTFFGPLQEQWSKALRLTNSQVLRWRWSWAIDPNTDEKENLSFLILFIAGFSTSPNFCQKPCTKDVHGAPGVQVQSWSARSPGPKLERFATLVMIFFV